MLCKTKKILAGLLILASAVNAREMPRSLREAERLYANGRYSEASDKAKSFQKLYPNNLQALLILGMSDYCLYNYQDSIKWFKKANQLSPNHPIASKYLTLLKEIEYRSGSFSQEPSEADFTDPHITADFYKRGYFNSIFPVESDNNDPGASTKLLEPALITGHLNPSTLRKKSDIALPNPGKATQSNSFYVFMEKMAREALTDKKYEKAYLFYAQLSASDPANRTYKIEQADAAYNLKRYAKVIELLLPISSKASLNSLTNKQKEKVKKLLEDSVAQKYVPGTNKE